MAVHHGKNGKVKLTTNVVAETTSWSINESVGVSDTTSMGDTAQTHLTGIPGWSGSVDCNYDPADTNGQNALTIGASVTIGFYSDGDGSGKQYFSGTASVTGLGRQGAMGEKVTASFSFTGNGALTSATVA
ncbi:MAG: hypothetical protein KL863_08935 [Rhizobium sp.]|nr:hypothetical protein [Rhizobium sp.]